MRSLVFLFLAGCGAPGFGDPVLTHHGSGCGRTEGIVLLGWTLGGAAPSSTSCSGIDHMSVEIDAGSCGATISPVPCALDRWRYDHLPEGSIFVTVSALSSSGATVAVGSTQLTLTTTVPSSPSPIDLQ